MSEVAVETVADEFALANSFEPTAEGEEADVPSYFTGPAAPEADAPTEPVADAEPETTAEPAPSENWRSNPEVADFIRTEVEALVAAQTQAAQPVEPETDALGEIDLFADDGGAQLGNFIRQTVQEALQPIAGPLQQQQQEAQAAAAQEAVKDVIAAVDVGGDFDKELAAELFYTYKDAAVQKYGVTNRAAEYAAEQAARKVRSIEDAAEKRGADKYKNELETLGGAKRDLGAGAQAVTRQSFDGDELSVAANWRT